MQRIGIDAMRYKAGETTDADGKPMTTVSLNAYLDRIDASPEARSHVLAWWTISGNGDPAVISAAEFLSSCAYGGGAPGGHDRCASSTRSLPALVFWPSG